MIQQILERTSSLISERRYFQILKWIGERKRNRSKAQFIGITGSSTKSTTTALLAHILEGEGRVLKMVELNFLQALMRQLAFMDRRAKFAVVEMGILKPGQIKRMAELLRPTVAIVTMVSLEHRSIFRTLEAIAEQKSDLVAAIPNDGRVVLNADDPLVMKMSERTGADIATFGRSDGADYRVTDISSGYPDRLSLTIVYRGGALTLKTKFVGEHFWLPVAAAAATALELGVAPEAVASRIASFEPMLERCGIFRVPNGPVFVLDTLKAPWHSVPLAIDVIARATAPHKRIILGHMSDYPGSNNKRYGEFYRRASAVADQVIFVGNHTHRSGASEEDLNAKRFLAFATTRQVADYIRETAVPDEVILIKGSADLHLERIALSLAHDVQCWTVTCGKKIGCVRCGLYGIPFVRHERDKRGKPKWRGPMQRAG